MYTFNKNRREELISKIRDIFTEDEKKLLYEACIFTADELSASNQKFQNILKPSNDLTAKAGELYELAHIFVDAN